ncbi:hypothetical protein CYMTET_37234 [Cymbomonas tetramitiformis]|uniref:Uncharacterized protein n=1 Tax=Cymbomonas tetramitiformis TaxID=36881 RepID=A0AAE0F667_9CHLO|nr:hypothetical protein CYMTET_37234 [Cymbomonas tetramitiformis]
MENTLLAMKTAIEAAYAANTANLASLKDKHKNRPDAPIRTKCKNPVDRYHALRMRRSCYSKVAYSRSKLSTIGRTRVGLSDKPALGFNLLNLPTHEPQCKNLGTVADILGPAVNGKLYQADISRRVMFLALVVTTVRTIFDHAFA